MTEDKAQTTDLSNKVIDNPNPFEKECQAIYNQAIDHAVSIVQEYKDAGYTHHAMGAIIERLTNLINK